MKKFIWLLVFSSVATATSTAQKKEVIDDFILKAMKAAPMVPSVGVSVVKDGKVVFANAYGDADPDKGIKATSKTAYYIASVTKSFTGLVAQMLSDEGVIDLDASLTNYKPFSEVSNREIFEELTIRHLLNHTSGLKNGYIVFREAYTGDKSLEILTMLLEEKTEKEKVGEYKYSNLGYNLFTLMLEAEFGWKWQELLQERIFTPLKMKNTSAYISKAEQENWNMAWPYLGYLSETPERSYLMKNDDMMQSAGGLLCSPRDAANWMIANLNGGVLNDIQVFKPETIESALRPTASYQREGDIFNDTGYGLGWVSAKFKEKDIRYHFGGYNGFFSHISIMPEENIGVTVFANEAAFGDNISNMIASFLYEYYLGEIDGPEAYDDRIEELSQRISGLLLRIKAHSDELAQREWQLELPKSKYQGNYENKHLGKMQVIEKDNELHVTMGPLKAVATPYTKKNSIRVEFTGSGTVCLFEVSEGEVVKMVYEGDVFERID